MRPKLSLATFALSIALFGLAAIAGAGCANPERKAARHIDYTGEIIQQASATIAADKELKHYPIVVDGFHNAMRLKGQVATPAQKARAANIVWGAQGVASVQNDLDVVPTSTVHSKSAPSAR